MIIFIEVSQVPDIRKRLFQINRNTKKWLQIVTSYEKHTQF